MEDPFPKGGREDVELNRKGVDEEGIRQGRPCIFANESHQEPKPNQHHDVYVLVEGVVCGCESWIVVNLVANED